MNITAIVDWAGHVARQMHRESMTWLDEHPGLTEEDIREMVEEYLGRIGALPKISKEVFARYERAFAERAERRRRQWFADIVRRALGELSGERSRDADMDDVIRALAGRLLAAATSSIPSYMRPVSAVILDKAVVIALCWVPEPEIHWKATTQPPPANVSDVIRSTAHAQSPTP